MRDGLPLRCCSAPRTVGVLPHELTRLSCRALHLLNLLQHFRKPVTVAAVQVNDGSERNESENGGKRCCNDGGAEEKEMEEI